VNAEKERGVYYSIFDIKKALRKKFLSAFLILVAGVGFKPTAFGL